MSENMVPIIIVPVIFFSFVAVIKILSDNAMRKRLIEKGLVDENVKHLFADRLERNVSASLKWGMILIAVGVAFLVGQFFPESISDEITLSAMLIMGGLALVSFYVFAQKTADKSQNVAKTQTNQ